MENTLLDPLSKTVLEKIEPNAYLYDPEIDRCGSDVILVFRRGDGRLHSEVYNRNTFRRIEGDPYCMVYENMGVLTFD